MAEEIFNPDDMPKTERYQIPYPGPDNLVRFAADQFGAMATAIDEKLGDVDDRQTDAARATIVRNTLTELQQTSPAVGQFGYVTDDGDNTGIWCWNGGSWSKVSGATPMTVVKPTLAELQTVTDLSDGVFGLVSDDPVASNNGVYVFNNNSWAPITGTSGGTLAASTLSQLEATSAPTGTLAYVSSDPKTSNNGLYVRTLAQTWDPIGGGTSTGQIVFTGEMVWGEDNYYSNCSTMTLSQMKSVAKYSMGVLDDYSFGGTKVSIYGSGTMYIYPITFPCDIGLTRVEITCSQALSAQYELLVKSVDDSTSGFAIVSQNFTPDENAGTTTITFDILAAEKKNVYFILDTRQANGQPITVDTTVDIAYTPTNATDLAYSFNAQSVAA